MNRIVLLFMLALISLPTHTQTLPSSGPITVPHGPVHGPLVIQMKTPADGRAPPRELHIVTTTSGEIMSEDQRGLVMGQSGPISLPGMDSVMAMRRPTLGLELVNLSSRLGGYFGVKSGVLVVSSDTPALGIQDGDVITQIDGRQPSTAQQARLILSSYSFGEKMVIHLVREKKALTLSVVTPEIPKVLQGVIQGKIPHTTD